MRVHYETLFQSNECNRHLRFIVFLVFFRIFLQQNLNSSIRKCKTIAVIMPWRVHYDNINYIIPQVPKRSNQWILFFSLSTSYLLCGSGAVCTHMRCHSISKWLSITNSKQKAIVNGLTLCGRMAVQPCRYAAVLHETCACTAQAFQLNASN